MTKKIPLNIFISKSTNHIIFPILFFHTNAIVHEVDTYYSTLERTSTNMFPKHKMSIFNNIMVFFVINYGFASISFLKLCQL